MNPAMPGYGATPMMPNMMPAIAPMPMMQPMPGKAHFYKPIQSQQYDLHVSHWPFFPLL